MNVKKIHSILITASNSAHNSSLIDYIIDSWLLKF